MSGSYQRVMTTIVGSREPGEPTVADRMRPHLSLLSQRPAPSPSADLLTHTESGEPWTADPYSRALRAGQGPLYLRCLAPHRGKVAELLPLDVERFCAAPDAADREVLLHCVGPVLDVGCGPGRLVAALAGQGVPALGVDISPAAVARTRHHGGTALRRSVFDRLPREGRWGTVLLMDGNVGIGGDPAALLTRLRDLPRAGGRLLAEAEAEEVDERLTVRVEDAHGRHGRPFRWARVGATALLHTAEATGWALVRQWTTYGRSFLEFERQTAVTNSRPARHGGRPDHP